MPFSGFLRPKPDGGKKPMIGKQIITPGSANTPINFGFHDGTGYSSAVVVPVAKVLNDTTIAGQAGTMPHKTGANTGTLYVTSGNIDAVPPLGYYDGTTYDYVHMPEPNLTAANILSGKSIFGMAGTASNIKSIQRGETTFAASSLTTDIAITAVDTTKSIVKISINPQNFDIQYIICSALLTSGTNLRLTRGSSSATVGIVSWEVIEFNNVKSLQSGTATISALSTNVTISSVDLNKSILFFSDNTTATGTGYLLFTIDGILNSTTNIKFGSASTGMTVQWYVIEFN